MEETLQEATESPDADLPELKEGIDFEEVILSDPGNPGFEIDGEYYDENAINNWYTDSINKAEWQKSNTEKAQSISKWNKFAERLGNDNDFKAHVKDYFYNNPEEYNSLGIDGLSPIEVEDAREVEDSTVTDNIPSALEDRLQTLEESHNERLEEQKVDFLDSQLTALENKHSDLLGKPEQVDEFLQFAENNAQYNMGADGVPDMNRMFKDWSYDVRMAELDHYKQLDNNKQRNAGKVVTKSEIGAIETKKPKTYNSIKDISVTDPDIAKYFNE